MVRAARGPANAPVLFRACSNGTFPGSAHHCRGAVRPQPINSCVIQYDARRMKQQLTYDNLAKWMSEAEDKVRKEMEELGQRPDSYNESIRQMIAARQGRLLALKDLRLRIRDETGVELKGTRAPPDVRKK